jgi:hypothetical protein
VCFASSSLDRPETFVGNNAVKKFSNRVNFSKRLRGCAARLRNQRLQ